MSPTSAIAWITPDFNSRKVTARYLTSCVSGSLSISGEVCPGGSRMISGFTSDLILDEITFTMRSWPGDLAHLRARGLTGVDYNKVVRPFTAR